MAEIIMGIDHGNGNMKGVHVNFPCGLVRYTSKPGRFMNEDILEYNGVYYTLSETRMPFKADKTVDEDYFILTLFDCRLQTLDSRLRDSKNILRNIQNMEFLSDSMESR